MNHIGTKLVIGQRFLFDPNANTLIDTIEDNEVTRLGSNESRILQLLSQHPNEVVTRNQLHEFVWREQGFEVDDSSLTQAISTLRKLLKDSTKSPHYIKTVPKRGYLLICSVNNARVEAKRSSETSIVEETKSVATNDESLLLSSTKVPSHETGYSQRVPENAHTVQASSHSGASSQAPLYFKEKEKSKHIPQPLEAVMMKMAILIAVLLPFAAFILSSPSESGFRQVAEFQGVQVKTPINHPPLQDWLPTIETCLTQYIENHQHDKAPQQVIATGGQNLQLVLNYIHAVEHSNENLTVRVYADRSNLNQVCR